MSRSIRQSAADRCELPSVIRWHVVAGTGCIAVLAVAGFLLVFGPSSPRQVRADQPTTPARIECVEPIGEPKFVPTDFVRLTPKAGRRHEKIPKPNSQDEDALLADMLASSREIDLESEPGATVDTLDAGSKHWRAAHKYLAARPDLKGLPLQSGEACLSGDWQARVLGRVSLGVREVQSLRDLRQPPPKPISELLDDYLNDSLRVSLEPQFLVRPFEHLYQVESEKVRFYLVSALGVIDGPAANEALARRAVFDPSPWVREKAVSWIRRDERESARAVFLSALRHPWAPAANHAALALVSMRDEQTVPRLRELLDEPDPSAPYLDEDGKWRRKELVRVNHLKNCLLCHPVSTDEKDLVQGVVPTPGQSLPRKYYHDPESPSRRRPALARIGDSSPVRFVRADIVFFRQDFSAMHRVKEPNYWPAIQRFDYLLQTRELTADEVATASRKARGTGTYPQREAVRWALAKLTGEVPRE